MNKTIEALDNLENGNITDFKEWLKRATKQEMLLAISNYAEDHCGDYGNIVNKMWAYLKV